MLLVNEATVLCEINPAGAKMLGVASDPVLGRPLRSFLSASSGQVLQKMLARARSDAAPETCELQLLPQGGVTRMLQCSAGTEASSGHFVLVLLAPASPGQDLNQP